MSEAAAPRRSIRDRLGLHRPELRAWAMYDWANSAFATTIMAAVLPVYYHQVAAVDLPENLRTAYWGYTQTVALVIVAFLSPVLGAAADSLGAKKSFLRFFISFGFAGCLALWFATQGRWLFASIAFIVGNIGFAAADVFYESLLPHIASPQEIDRVSTAGYALGYVGGGLLLAVQLAWITSPQTFGLSDGAVGSRLAFVSVAIWWVLFSIPLFRTVKEPTHDGKGMATLGGGLSDGFQQLAATFREIRRYREAFWFLLAFWLYNDGIITIVKMAAIYGAEIGIGQTDLIGALLVVQFLGIPCTFAFGTLAERIGAKRAIMMSLVVYTGISVLGYYMSTAMHFWILACAVAVVQGGSQALSRSLFATLIPPEKSSQFFGFYNVSGRFGSILGPFVFAVVSQATGGSRLSILTLIAFFAGGMLVLARVDENAGRLRASV
ncbi:MAG: MFS transporter [Bryobacterales bacterium]|nr:MFS transporter [Bryobacterales bacterium]MDE0294976.1 MFS transporter [Bryobacterales bacterium]